MFDPAPHLFTNRFFFLLVTGDAVLENILLVQDLGLEMLFRNLVQLDVQGIKFLFLGFLGFRTHVETRRLVKRQFRKLE